MIVAGFGFRAAASDASLRDAYRQASGGRAVQALATVADKTAALQPLARDLGVPVIAVAQADLAQVATATDSAVVRRARGAGSVAEATALVAIGPGGALLGARVISGDRMASCALAQGSGTEGNGQ